MKLTKKGQLRAKGMTHYVSERDVRGPRTGRGNLANRGRENPGAKTDRSGSRGKTSSVAGNGLQS